MKNDLNLFGMVVVILLIIATITWGWFAFSTALSTQYQIGYLQGRIDALNYYNSLLRARIS